MALNPPRIYRDGWKNEYLALLSGLANAGGGKLIISKSEKEETADLRYVHNSFETIPVIVEKELGISCSANPILEGENLCLEIMVPPQDVPVSYKKEFYLYRDGKNELVSTDEIACAWQNERSIPWEQQVQHDVSVTELAQKAAERFFEKTAHGDEHYDVWLATHLEENGLLDAKTGKLTNGGVLLLHERPDWFIPGAFVQITMTRPDGFEIQYIDEVTGPLLDQLNGTIELLEKKYLPLLDLENEALLPRNVLQEALTNALVHKDYESGVPVKVNLNPQELRIDNVGRPPRNWSLEEFTGRHISRPNNPLIARTLQHARAFNGIGDGIRNMVHSLRISNFPLPNFELHADETLLTIPLARKRKLLKMLSSSTAPDPSFRDRSLAAAYDLDLTQTDEYVLKILAANGRITARQLSKYLEVSESTIRRAYRKLRSMKLIERRGSDKKGYWKVNT